MTEREQQINRGLHALDDAHRLGRIARDEYRLRRRHLLAPLNDETYETVRDTVRRAAPAHATQKQKQAYGRTSDRSARPGLYEPRAGSGWRHLALSVCVLGALGVGVGLLFWLMLRT
jgi:hypothetical protein